MIVTVSFKDVSVKNKIIILCGILISLTIVAIFINLTLQTEIKTLADIRYQSVSLSKIALHESSSFRGYILTGDQTFLTRLDDQKANFQETIRMIKTLTKDDNILRLLSTAESKEQTWHQEAVNPLIGERKKVDAGQIKMDDLAKSFQALIDPSLNDQRTSANDEIVKIANKAMEDGITLTYQTMTIILVVEISFGAVLTFIISRSIITPLKRLHEIASITSRGDLTHEIQVNSSNEIGKLAASFKDMTEGLRNIVGNIFNTTSEVSSISQQISSSTEQMNASTQQVSSTIQQIAKSSQNQAREVEQLNRAIDKLGSTMKDLESKAKETTEISTNMYKIAETGGESASDASERMARISRVSEESVEKIRRLVERSAQITNVLDVIRKIADQTNLLALNAAIEAARAGESGKGFAVVADEVRRLAENSAKAAEEIDLQITQIQEEAKTTVKGIEESSKEILEGKEVIGRGLKALEDIAKKVKGTTENVNKVTSLIQDQVSSVEQIRKSVNEIAASAEENASSTEETASAMEEHAAGMEEISSGIQNLGNLSEQLLELVKKFKIPEQVPIHEKPVLHIPQKHPVHLVQSIARSGDGERRLDSI